MSDKKPMPVYKTNSNRTTEIITYEFEYREVIRIDQLHDEYKESVRGGKYCIAEQGDEFHYFDTLEDARNYLYTNEIDMFKLTYGWS